MQTCCQRRRAWPAGEEINTSINTCGDAISLDEPVSSDEDRNASNKQTASIEGDARMNTKRQAVTIKERTMKPTTSNLIRWAGLSAMLAGIFYVIVGIFHPL